MSIENRRQLENTRLKLQELEDLYTKIRQEPTSNDRVRDLTLRSLKKRINQFTEEIARFEARANPAAPNDCKADGENKELLGDKRFDK